MTVIDTKFQIICKNAIEDNKLINKLQKNTQTDVEKSRKRLRNTIKDECSNRLYFIDSQVKANVDRIINEYLQE